MYLSPELSELDIVTRGGGELREDSDSGVIGVGGVLGDGMVDLSKGEGSGESGEGGRDSGRATLAGETVDKEADSIVYDTEAAERSLVTHWVIRAETGIPEDEEVRWFARLAAGMREGQ